MDIRLQHYKSTHKKQDSCSENILHPLAKQSLSNMPDILVLLSPKGGSTITQLQSSCTSAASTTQNRICQVQIHQSKDRAWVYGWCSNVSWHFNVAITHSEKLSRQSQ